MSRTVEVEGIQRAYKSPKELQRLGNAYLRRPIPNMADLNTTEKLTLNARPTNMLDWVKSPTKNLNPRFNVKRLSEKFNTIRNKYEML